MLGFSAGLAAALDHDEGFQTEPVMPLLKRLDVVDHDRGAAFDTAVIAIDGGAAGYFVSEKSLAFRSRATSLISARNDGELSQR